MHTSETGVTGEERGSLRVLVVDDEPMMGTTLRVALGEEYEVVLVDSGARAQQMLAGEGGFAAVLCDLMMPDISGMALYEWIREQVPDVADRIVFMSGGAYTRRAHEFLESLGPGRHIEKPFDVDELLELVRRITAG